MESKIGLMEISTELTGIVVLLNALESVDKIPPKVEDGLYTITAALERLIKEIDSQV